MQRPSLKQMIGQLFIIGFTGKTVSKSHPIFTDIDERSLGGVIIFDRHLATKAATNNITGAAQLKQLTATLQEFSSTKLLIAVDQEGGRVNRFREEFGFPVSPSAEQLGAATGTMQSRASATQTAYMLKNCGVNLNLAPVVDLNSNNKNPIIGKVERSFSDKPDKVFEHASIWVTEHRKAGILSCLKHFPGHGSSKNDSHLGFVDITKSWQTTELEPYKKLITKGLADAIMVGHLYNKDLDPDYPATLSVPTINKLLKEDMQFGGVVISDDLQMRAITDKYALEDACIMALKAGVDLIIIGNNLSYDPTIFSRIHKAIEKAVNKGSLSEETIRNAWKRVQTFKSLLQ